jgi:hypothetical protein
VHPCMCVDEQSSQRLIRARDYHSLGSGARLKAMDARNLPKPVKVVLRMKDLNSGLHTEH